MAWSDGLEGEAFEIASTDASPLRVLAGPGTGKTYALQHRIARFLEENVEPTKILILTFTRLAAQDMEQALHEMDVPGVEKVRKGTLHAFCFSLLSKANVFDTTQREPRTLLNFEERFLLEDLGEEGGECLKAREKRLKDFESAWATEQDQEPGWPHTLEDQEFQIKLIEWLKFHQAMLLGELIPITLQYLRTNPECEEIHEYSHVLVDEYQDLNRAEQDLIDLLATDASLTVVGDEDQSIYETFRYAHPEGIAQFHLTHEQTFDIPLELCRRCPRNIVVAANHLIHNNNRRIRRRLTPSPNKEDGRFLVVQWRNNQLEADGIAEYICRMIRRGDFDPGKVIVLSPRRQLGYMIRDALVFRGIPSHSFYTEEALDGNPKIPESNEAQKAFALLTLLARRDDPVALRCWIGFDHNNLRKMEYARLRNFCAEEGISTLTALENLSNGNLRIPYTNGITAKYIELRRNLAELDAMNDRDKFDQIFPANAPWAEPFRNIIRVANWSENLSKALDIIKTNITQPELPVDVPYVRVMSIHKSKGLTADHVLLTGCIDGIIPSSDYDALPFDAQMRALEEQRRLFFVGITRPRESLIISSSARISRDLAYKILPIRLIRGGDLEFVPVRTSRFVAELGPHCPHPIRGEDLLNMV